MHSLGRNFVSRRSKAAWLAVLACAIPGHAAACSTAGWDAVTTNGSAAQVLVVGSPTDTTPVPRYSGPCAAMARAPGNFVTDELATSDWALHARFYVFVDVPSNEVTFFRAENAAGQPMITIRQNLTTLKFDLSSGVTTTAPVVPGRWYAIELDWYAGQAMTVEVRGAGADPQPRFSTSAALLSDRIKRVSLGWISGAGTGRIAIDAYAARRLTGWESDIKIGRLCRGDSSGDTYYFGLEAGDMVRARNESSGLGLTLGQPDCDENGVVNSTDATCIGTAIIRNLQCD